VGLHVLKTGDYDALLILFMTLYAFMYFLYLYWDLNERKYIYLFVLFLCLAMLTKGIAGLMLLPALFIYTLLEKKLKATMVNSDFWKAGGIFLICTLGYYLLREQYNPGYIAAVIDNEITGRYLEVVEKHNAPFSFYFTNMINERYLPWIYIFPFSVIICYVSKNRIARDLLVFCLINIFAYFLIISFGMTKLKWYDAPLYPFLAIINGCALWIIFQYIVDKVKFPFRKEFLFPAFAFIIFFYPYKQNAKIFFTFLASPPHPDVQFSGFMNELKTSNPELREYAVIPRWVEMYHGHASFFVKLFNSQGYSLSIASLQTNKLKESSYAMASEEKTKWLLQTMYHCKIISTYKNCILYQIISQVDSYPSAILKLAKLEIQGSEAMMSTIEKSAKENSRNFEQELHLYAIDYLERNKNITSAEADYLKLKLPDNRK
jgi:hypothetical protein